MDVSKETLDAAAACDWTLFVEQVGGWGEADVKYQLNIFFLAILKRMAIPIITAVETFY